MTVVLQVRPEQPADVVAIDAVTRAAFAGLAHGTQTEHRMIAALRAADALALSLVAEEGGAVLGHIAFSRVAVTDRSTGWFGLAPVSVLPDAQGRGIGRTLIERGLEHLRNSGAAGCVVLGEPALYQRFGFRNTPGLVLPGVPQEYFLALAWQGMAQGEVRFHDAFEITA